MLLQVELRITKMITLNDNPTFRVFFPACKLNDFVHTLESVLHLRVDALAPNDEKSFIQFYGLPTNSLICNKVGGFYAPVCSQTDFIERQAVLYSDAPF